MTTQRSSAKRTVLRKLPDDEVMEIFNTCDECNERHDPEDVCREDSEEYLDQQRDHWESMHPHRGDE